MGVVNKLVEKGQKIKNQIEEKKVKKNISKLEAFEYQQKEVFDFLDANYEKFGNLINMDSVDIYFIWNGNNKWLKTYFSKSYANKDSFFRNLEEEGHLGISQLMKCCDVFVKENQEKFEELLIKDGDLHNFKTYVSLYEPKNAEKIIERIKGIKAEKQEMFKKKQAIRDALDIPEVVNIYKQEIDLNLLNNQLKEKQNNLKPTNEIPKIEIPERINLNSKMEEDFNKI